MSPTVSPAKSLLTLTDGRTVTVNTPPTELTQWFIDGYRGWIKADTGGVNVDHIVTVEAEKKK